MAMQTEIRYEAKVSPELVALLRGGPGFAAGRSMAAPPRPAERAPQGEPDRPAADTQPTPPDPAGDAWPQQSLRRDGRRPLTFRGLPLWGDTALADQVDPTGRPCQAQRSFRLFVTADQRLVAHLAVTPQEGLPLRSIHRAAFMDAPGDLDRFLAENDPSDCAAVAPWSGAAAGLELLWADLRLGLPLSPGQGAGAATH